MGSGRQWVGRLQGGSCSNDNGGDVVTLAAARLDGGLREESMRVHAGDGGRRTTQQEETGDNAGQVGRRGQHGERGHADNARRADDGRQDKRMGAEDTTVDANLILSSHQVAKSTFEF
jgi:hypothetical protein